MQNENVSWYCRHFLFFLAYFDFMKRIHIESEIGRLKRVIIHNPGPEIEAMTPREAEHDLYNDIIPLSAVQKEYKKLHLFLKSVSETYELTDLLEVCLKDERDRLHFLKEYSQIHPIDSIVNKLMELSAKELAHSILTGILAPVESLAHFSSKHSFISNPLPNAYFMRDSLALIGDRVISAAFKFDVRMAEAYITRFIFSHHPEFKNSSVLLDGARERSRLMTIEGGDIHVLAPHVLAVGISERTSAFAIDMLAHRIAKLADDPYIIFAVDLPKERATIHLDMVFTMIDRDAALAYKPVMVDSMRVPVYKLETTSSGEIHYSQEKSLFHGLEGVGISLVPIFCGNGKSVFQEREQWLSGANSFAFAPGKILMYSCNIHTLEALNREGFSIVSAQEFLSHRAESSKFRRLVVAFEGIELARGGGGARCMTLPIERERLD